MADILRRKRRDTMPEITKYSSIIFIHTSRNLGKITGKISRPQFHLSLLGSVASLRTCRHLAAKVATSKGGGKQWQTTPKNLPRMQCARAIPVTWLGSGSCQPGLDGWILMNEWMKRTIFKCKLKQYFGVIPRKLSLSLSSNTPHLIKPEDSLPSLQETTISPLVFNTKYKNLTILAE